jgi:hypothetical protein
MTNEQYWVLELCQRLTSATMGVKREGLAKKLCEEVQRAVDAALYSAFGQAIGQESGDDL